MSGKDEKRARFSRTQFGKFKQRLHDEGALGIRILSGSMEPLIQTGEELQVIPIKDVADLKPFDIIVYWDRDILICHYLWSINQRFRTDAGLRIFGTRSLASQREDFPIDESQILGRVIGKRISRWQQMKILLGF